MYCDFWGMNRRPFDNVTDASFFYESASHSAAWGKLGYAFTEGLGIGMVTGQYGIGRSLIATMVSDVVEEVGCLHTCIKAPVMASDDLIVYIAHKLGVQNMPEKKGDLLLSSVMTQFEKHIMQAGPCVVIIDEADSICDAETLEVIRLLANFEDKGKKLVSIL